MQRVEAVAKSGNLSNEFEELAAVIIRRFNQGVNFEGFEVVCLEDELLKRPLLQLVLVPVILDKEILEALLFVDCTPKFVNHRVEHIGRCS